MKKISLIIMVSMVLVLSGCGKGGNVDFNNTETITFHDLTAEMPKAFTIDNENSNNSIILYWYDDKYNTCALYFNISDYPKSDMKEALQEEFYDKTDWSYNEKTINGYKWSIGYREEDIKFNQTYYVINKNGKEYTLGYDDFGSGEKCADALEIIEKSLNFK